MWASCILKKEKNSDNEVLGALGFDLHGLLITCEQGSNLHGNVHGKGSTDDKEELGCAGLWWPLTCTVFYEWGTSE